MGTGNNTDTASLPLDDMTDGGIRDEPKRGRGEVSPPPLENIIFSVGKSRNYEIVNNKL